ncbi:Hypothetical predicted protein [Mytilus galloprovincialis]|uniref:Uncharacterized protein n=1 Tax=Mytilus galloprovincialis TaxID=29158 RepID=A0A8B6GSJ8_MYTGA|nr:Hypothetical predicted protein [Mytilus galloprovincialis]
MEMPWQPFAVGLAQDSSNTSLLSGLVDSALKSPLKEKLGPTFQQLQKLKLHQSPFVIISVIGQELLAAGLYGSSIAMLEAALQIGDLQFKVTRLCVLSPQQCTLGTWQYRQSNNIHAA